MTTVNPLLPERSAVMIGELTRRETLKLVAAVSLGDDRRSSRNASMGGEAASVPTLNRLATTALGAEITGLFVAPDGTMFFNVQHPDGDNPAPFDHGGVGVVNGLSLHDLPRDFPSVQVPDGAEEGRTVHTAVGEFDVLANGGDPTDDGEGLGVAYSPDGEALTGGNLPDFNGYVDDPASDEGYLFTSWESRPGMVSRLRLRRGPTDGRWQVQGATNVDFRGVYGTWGNCFGSVSPWGTPLCSEENFSASLTPRWNDPDWDRGDDEDGDEVRNLAAYLGYFPNPYRYGYIVEITKPLAAEAVPVKRFVLGRFAHETAVVMPDDRTVYLTDDGTAKAFYKFVADERRDLSAGSLFAARATQAGDGGDPSTVGFDLEWIELAHGTEAEIEGWIAAYDGITTDDYDDGETSYISDSEVEEWAAGDSPDDRVAFLETMQAAAAVGATVEFRKMEGLGVAPDAAVGDYLYVAVSSVDDTMADGEGDVRLDGNDYGAVYRMRLERGYDVRRLEPVVTGGPDANICGGCPYDADPDSGSTVCRTCSFNPTTADEADGSTPDTTLLGASGGVDPENTIANPDNLVVLPDGRVVVGEDTAEHEANVIWVYSPGA